MQPEYRLQLGIDQSFTVTTVSDKWKASKGQDTDTAQYEVRDPSGELVTQYEIRDSTSMYPPFGRSVSYTEYSATGQETGSGSLKF